MAGQFRFVMRSGPIVGKVYPVNGQEISIGRDAANAITINDAEVSRKHARMELRGSAYIIQDLGSTNGTFVNNVRITGMQVLNPGDTVAFGEGIVLAYESVMDANATVLSSKAPPTVVQRPAPAPAPAPTYSGKVPAGPVPMPVPVVPGKKKFPIWIIIVILLVMVICACVAIPVIIDYAHLDCFGPFKYVANMVVPILNRFGYTYVLCP